VRHHRTTVCQHSTGGEADPQNFGSGRGQISYSIQGKESFSYLIGAFGGPKSRYCSIECPQSVGSEQSKREEDLFRRPSYRVSASAENKTETSCSVLARRRKSKQASERNQQKAKNAQGRPDMSPFPVLGGARSNGHLRNMQTVIQPTSSKSGSGTLPLKRFHCSLWLKQIFHTTARSPKFVSHTRNSSHALRFRSFQTCSSAHTVLRQVTDSLNHRCINSDRLLSYPSFNSTHKAVAH